jgi:phenylacetate-CoA ligase
LAEVGATHQLDVSTLGVQKLLLTGEPGASVPHIRSRIEELWGAKVLDHGGATEIGPWGYGDVETHGMHILETEFIAEFLSVETGTPAAEGELAELVLTNLGRIGCPVIRYRTGDLVRPIWQHDRGNQFVYLDGGILGREQILRSFPEVVEYRMIVRKVGSMDHLLVEVEDRLEEPRRIAEELRLRLGLKVEVKLVDLGSLPRFEGKGKRFVDER